MQDVNIIAHSAKEIAEDALQRTGTAIMAGEFNAYAACFRLPQTLEIDSKLTEIRSADDLKFFFDKFQTKLKLLRVTLLQRHCISADYVSDDLIQTTHETRLVSGAELVERSYPVFSELHREGAGWLIGSNRVAFPNESILQTIGQNMSSNAHHAPMAKRA